MKILQIVPIMNIGGAQTMCENLCYELKEIDESNIIEIISFYDEKSCITNRLEEKKFKIHFLHKHRGPDIKMFFTLVKKIKLFEPDIIHTHLYALAYVYPALKISGVKNAKIIHTLHSVASKENSKKIIKLQKKLFRKNKVTPVSISEEVQKTVEQVYGISEKSTPLIYNGVNLNKCIAKKDYGKKKNILHIGRFVDVKNHEFLLKLFQKLLNEYDKDLKLTLVGEGPLEEPMKKLAKELNIQKNVSFLGAQSNCYCFFEEADVFVLTSKYEGMPMTVIEAMGSGVPCVTSSVGGLKDMIIEGENGLLCNDKSDFFLKIKELLENEEKRKKIGKRSIIDAQKYSSKTMAEKYYELYKGDN